MARATVSFAEAALEDLENLGQWYADQQVPAVGRRSVDEIFARVETLKDHPDMGRIVPEFGLPFLRELIYPPFRIVYRRDASKVRVVRVWRSERLLQLASKNTTA